jgi:ribosomal protein S18 acetylase RimI-like enzyme
VSLVEIREYDAGRDHDSVRACCVELQEFERRLDPRMPPGDQIVDAYLKLLFARCSEFSGVVLVAHADRVVVGYVAVWTQYRSSEPDDDPLEHGFIADLIVSSTYRGRGIGLALLRAAEERVRAAGAKSLQLSVKAGNTGAQRLYSAEGFVESEIYLEKVLVHPGAHAAQQADEADVE